MNDEGVWCSLVLLTTLSIWGWQGLGGEETPVGDIKAAEMACVTNGGLSYIRHEIMEREDYICKNGAEGIIQEYLKYTKETIGEYSKAN